MKNIKINARVIVTVLMIALFTIGTIQCKQVRLDDGMTFNNCQTK
jgi:hypothetical protein